MDEALCEYLADQSELECPVCLNVWRDPVEVLPCRHIFCRRCVAPLSKCPDCRGDVASVQRPNRVLLNIIAGLRVRCTACGWSGVREQFDTHPHEKLLRIASEGDPFVGMFGTPTQPTAPSAAQQAGGRSSGISGIPSVEGGASIPAEEPSASAFFRPTAGDQQQHLQQHLPLSWEAEAFNDHIAATREEATTPPSASQQGGGPAHAGTSEASSTSSAGITHRLSFKNCGAKIAERQWQQPVGQWTSFYVTQEEYDAIVALCTAVEAEREDMAHTTGVNPQQATETLSSGTRIIVSRLLSYLNFIVDERRKSMGEIMCTGDVDIILSAVKEARMTDAGRLYDMTVEEYYSAVQLFHIHDLGSDGTLCEAELYQMCKAVSAGGVEASDASNLFQTLTRRRRANSESCRNSSMGSSRAPVAHSASRFSLASENSDGSQTVAGRRVTLHELLLHFAEEGEWCFADDDLSNEELARDEQQQVEGTTESQRAGAGSSRPNPQGTVAQNPPKKRVGFFRWLFGGRGPQKAPRPAQLAPAQGVVVQPAMRQQHQSGNPAAYQPLYQQGARPLGQQHPNQRPPPQHQQQGSSVAMASHEQMGMLYRNPYAASTTNSTANGAYSNAVYQRHHGPNVHHF